MGSHRQAEDGAGQSHTGNGDVTANIHLLLLTKSASESETAQIGPLRQRSCRNGCGRSCVSQYRKLPFVDDDDDAPFAVRVGACSFLLFSFLLHSYYYPTTTVRQQLLFFSLGDAFET